MRESWPTWSALSQLGSFESRRPSRVAPASVSRRASWRRRRETRIARNGGSASATECDFPCLAMPSQLWLERSQARRELGARYRVKAHAQPHPPRTRSPPRATVPRARALRRKAGVRISAVPSSSSRALPPSSRRWTRRRRTIALLGRTPPSSRSRWRPNVVTVRTPACLSAASTASFVERLFVTI
jgi:hypothetical protein